MIARLNNYRVDLKIRIHVPLSTMYYTPVSGYNAAMAGLSVVDEIKQKIDIVEFVGSYVTLKHAGKYFKANCPFHEERTPSFVVSPDIGRWHCFGACHEGGDIFNFLMKWENISFAEALKTLAQRAGVTLDDVSKVGYTDPNDHIKATIYEIQDLAARYFAYVLAETDTGKPARDYLKYREVSSDLARTFQLGYAPDAWTSLRDYLYKKGYTDKDLTATGLFVSGDHGIYDRFRGRLMFPIKNTRGQVVGFSGRLMKEVPTEKDGGKYINSPETLVYRKRESLFGFQQTRDAIRKSNTAIVVEGEFDMLIPYAKGISNIVAIKGSAFTDDQLKMLRRTCERLILALDNDDAGFDALRKSTFDAQQYGFELYVCVIPEGKDPDEAARKDIVRLKEAIRHPVPVYDYIIDTYFARVDEKDPFTKKHFMDGAIPFIDRIVNPIVKTHYIQKAAHLLSASEGDVQALLREYRHAKPPSTRPATDTSAPVKHGDRAGTLARRILCILLTAKIQTATYDELLSLLEAEDFADLSHREMYTHLRRMMRDTKSTDTSELASRLPAELRPLYDELYLYASTIEGAEDAYLLRLGLELKKLVLTERLRQKSRDEADSDEADITALSTQLSAVEKRLSML